MSKDPNKKYKKPKKKTLATTRPGTSTSGQPNNSNSDISSKRSDHVCPLLAKDSEWVDSLQDSGASGSSSNGDCFEEEVLQLVDSEDGPQTEPLAIMFPGLLDKDPKTLQGMLNRALSTTEVTRQLVDLGQKANFTFMKKAERIIPPDKKWLDGVIENNSDHTMSKEMSGSSCDASSEISTSKSDLPEMKRNIFAKPISSGLPKSFHELNIQEQPKTE